MPPTPKGCSSTRSAARRCASIICCPRGRARSGSSTRSLPPCRQVASMADQPLLSLRGVCKSFGGIQAVHTVTFDVHPGESIGLVGPNGAGKTTLFNCVCGQLRPEEGDIVFDGTELIGLPTFKRARLGIGRTYQRIEVFT